MRLAAAAFVALVSAFSATCAFADPTYTFTITDNDPNSTGTFSFSLSSLGSYTTQGYGDYGYSNVSATVDGSSQTFSDVYFYPSEVADYLAIPLDTDGYTLYMNFTSGAFLSGDPDVGAPTVTPGTYMGSVACDEARLRSPFVAASGLPGVMAFIQVQFPYGSYCDDSLTLDVTGSSPVTPPSSVTPEPASLGLFATGVLGIAGVVRRRLRA
jgi:hypothetical protein